MKTKVQVYISVPYLSDSKLHIHGNDLHKP